MNRLYLTLLALALLSPVAHAETPWVQAHDLIRFGMPDDERDRLLGSLEGLLRDLDAEATETAYVDPEHYLRYEVFFEEFHGFRDYGRMNLEDAFTANVVNVLPLGDGLHEIQLSMTAQFEGQPLLNRMIVRIDAVRGDAGYSFRCTAERTARTWHEKQVGSIRYVYPDRLDMDRAEAFDAFNHMLAKKVGVPTQPVSYVHAASIQEALAYLGIDYHILVNGRKHAAFNTRYEFISGRNEEGYEHDLLHVYMEETYGREVTYRPFEEGMAMFYAGSWGDPYEYIVGLLADYLAERPESDVRALYDEKPRLGKHDLRYIVNAMLVEELDRRFEFDTIVDVLHSGKLGEEHFAKIETHLGIGEQALNDWVRSRLQERKKPAASGSLGLAD